MEWLALDIGGANLKAANGKGYAHMLPFALWREPEQLALQLRTLLVEAPAHSHLAVTMTGELADCFENKTVGVKFILDAIQQATGGKHTRVYLVNGKLVTPQVAALRPLEAAASNWHVLARFVARHVGETPALLIDVGSTTTDVIPLIGAAPAARGRTDTERLVSGELVYTGVDRSPVCALVHEVPYRKSRCRVAQERFATTADVYVILRDLPEDSANLNTADGRPLTKAAARARLGRSICADNIEFHHRDAVVLAQAVAAAQEEMIFGAVRQVVRAMAEPPGVVVVSGQGEFLAHRVAQHLGESPEIIALSAELGPALSRCAPAHALATIAREMAAAQA